MDKKTTKYYFFFLPSFSAEQFLILFGMIVMIASGIIYAFSWVYSNTIGFWINPLLSSLANAYFSLLIAAPILILMTPEQIVSGFGRLEVTEFQIQQFYNKINSPSPSIANSEYVCILLSVLTIVFMLVLFIRGGMKTRVRDWIARYISIVFFVVIPLVYFLEVKFGLIWNRYFPYINNYNEMHRRVVVYLQSVYIEALIVSILLFVLTSIIMTSIRQDYQKRIQSTNNV